MPKGIPKNGINKGWFKNSSLEKNCLICNNFFLVVKCRKNIAKFCSKNCYLKSKKRTIIKRTCHLCNKEYFFNKSKNREKTSLYCSRKCQCISIAPKEHSIERNKKISNSKKGKKQPWVVDRNRKYVLKKELRWNWNPDRNEELEKLRIRSSKIYSEWRKNVMKRDNWICQFCDKKGGNLEVDHIKQFILVLKQNNIKCLEDAIICKELWDINNGRTLCKPCHKTTFKGQYR